MQWIPKITGGDLTKRLVLSENDTLPIGFYLVRQSDSATLTISYQYVSPNFRNNRIALIELVDFLRYALTRTDIKRVMTHVLSGRLHFFESDWQRMVSTYREPSVRVYEIDLSDKSEAKQILDQKLKREDIVLLQ